MEGERTERTDSENTKSHKRKRGVSNLNQVPLELTPANTSFTQEIAPGTPVHEQDFDEGIYMAEPQAPALPAPLNKQADLGVYGVQSNICRHDLSMAAVLISTHLDTAESAQSTSEEGVSSHADDGASKEKQVFEKGNYNRYYGYRLANGETEDPRLQVLQKNWFVNRRCMDVGCNEGILTLAVASKYHAKSMLGIDIDQDLVKRACRTLQKERSKVSKQLATRMSAAKYRPLSASATSLAHVWFQQGDILTSKLEAESLDTIMCMSVTKWIHLHGGDETMEKFFSRVKELLVPGGYFVLEPQPWKSYKRAVNKLNAKKVSHFALADLHLPPEKFPEHLTQILGFRLLKEFRNPSKKAGFDRPVQWYKKERC